MLKHLAIVLILGMIASLAAFAWLGSYSPSYQTCEAKERDQQAHNKPPEPPELALGRFAICEGAFLDANGDTITGVATALLTVVTIGLMLLAGEQSRTSRAELRAYIAAIPSFIYSFDGNHVPSIRFKLTNTGQTPAHKVRHRAEIELLPYPLKTGLSLPPPSGEFSNPMVLFPRTEFEGVKIRTNSFSASEIADIRNGMARIYIYGEVFYSDVFGEDWTTRFCHSVIADRDTIRKLCTNYEPSNLKVSFEIAPMGNDAT